MKKRNKNIDLLERLEEKPYLCAFVIMLLVLVGFYLIHSGLVMQDKHIYMIQSYIIILVGALLVSVGILIISELAQKSLDLILLISKNSKKRVKK